MSFSLTINQEEIDYMETTSAYLMEVMDPATLTFFVDPLDVNDYTFVPPTLYQMFAFTKDEEKIEFSYSVVHHSTSCHV